MALSKYTLRQFEAFIAVSETLGFRPAGERLGLTTSAVSQLIAELEATLGFRLFERTTRQVKLTGAGRDYLPSASAVLRHLRQAELDAEAVRDHATGLVKIAAPLVMACTLLPAALRAYAEHEPRVVVRIVDTPDGDLMESVRRGDVDLAVGSRRSTNNWLKCTPLFASPWTLWCARSHPLARKRAVRWEQLAEMPLMTAFNHEEIDTVLGRHARAPVRRIEVMGNLSTALGLSREGFAPTLAPSYVAVLADLMGLVKKPLIDPRIDIEVSLYESILDRPSPAASAFGEFLSNWLVNWHTEQSHDH